MARPARGALLALLAAQAIAGCHGALNIETDAPEEMVKALRQSIFVETAYLAEREEERCSSLDGPACLAALLGGHSGSDFGAVSLSAPPLGVIPERLLHDLGVAGAGDLDFVTPEYAVLEAFRRQHEVAANAQALPLLAGASGQEVLQRARASAERGVLHFHGLLPDSRLPLSFSRGLPSGLVATWDGRWLVRDCSATSGPAPSLALPAPDDRHALAPPRGAGGLSAAGAGGGSKEVSVTVELAGSVGYLRFSRPVVVRSLFARWLSADDRAAKKRSSSPRAIVGGRLGLQTVWSTHLDQAKLREGAKGAWLDVAGGRLNPVDEVAFVGALGLEVGAVEVLASSTPESEEEEERTVLLLAPVAPSFNATSSMQEAIDGQPAKEKPRFQLRMEKLSAAAATHIATLQEVVERNLRLVAAPRPRAAGHLPPTSHVPGLYMPQSPPQLPATAENMKWVASVAAGQAMFQHDALDHMINAHAPGVATSRDGHASLVARAKALTEDFRADWRLLPADLRRDLPRERDEIIEALLGWVVAGGRWPWRTPSSLPRRGSEEALARYTTAKRWQTKLDLLTAAFLCTRQ